MATTVQSLFGLTPEDLQAQQDAALNAQALQYAQLDPMQAAQMGFFRAGSQLGSGVAGLMGYENPQMRQSRELQTLSKQFDFTSPEGLSQAAGMLSQRGYGQQALPLAQKAQEMMLSQAQAKKAAAEQNKIELSVRQEEDLRNKLSQLPPDASEDQIMSVLIQYGSPDKVLAALQSSADKKAQREATAEQKRLDIESKLELKKLEIQGRLDAIAAQGATQKEIEAARIAARRELAMFAASLKQGTESAKPMPATLQRAEDKDFEAIDTLKNINTNLDPVINALGGYGDKAVKPTLILGPAKNAYYQAQNAAGMSSPQSLAYSQLVEAKTKIVNDALRLNKGTQTEGDAVRAANEVEAAFAKNDTEATRKALVRLVEINKRAEANVQSQIDRRRTSQNRETFFGKQPSQPAAPKTGTTKSGVKYTIED